MLSNSHSIEPVLANSRELPQGKYTYLFFDSTPSDSPLESSTDRYESYTLGELRAMQLLFHCRKLKQCVLVLSVKFSRSLLEFEIPALG